mmetsp:Transcript_8877/g.18475  ORF Transcript_8877/g.18475 Transcript_8877/m.18475 type:complete len:172 (+) Transcript_8877:218-733(+)|eukprot:CAMPEP_0171412596 /NCGR_PEP_ID=MMETSP0880-20121228/32896_1 /TAXON_ID=67004 /ORGANISM="Thalassiosira weissflogii, Strain CCMP1336" /LENGTH=171 /DNA_ID=CAMNT_0011930013 /DNA_START=101 /DNA_END=616 /DNA_ORIENTATION=+
MATEHTVTCEKSDGVYNIFRDSALRYCGYANEIGESFRYQYPKLVTPSYVVAFGYCFADAVSAGYQVMSEDERVTVREYRAKETRAAIATFDTLLWQSLASVAIPGGVINLIVRSSRFAVARSVGLPVLVSKWLPTAAGLGSIPFIIAPIDNCVDFALDNSIRKLLQQKEE